MTRIGSRGPGGIDGTSDDAFARFYTDHVAELVRTATLLVGSRAEGEELVQDTFAKVHARWERIDAPLSYTRRAVVNAANSLLRRRAVRQRYERQLAPAVSELGARELLDAVGRLPGRQRAAVVLRFYADLSERETAAAIGCRPGTVGSLVSRAMDALRQELDR